MKFYGALVLVATGGLIYWGMNNLAGAFCTDNTFHLILYGALFGIGISFSVAIGILLFSDLTESKLGCLVMALLAAAGVGAMFYFGSQRAVQACPANEIYTALSGACKGRGNPAAGEFDPAQAGGNHLVVMNMAGEIHPISSAAPPTWKPASLADTDSVLCIASPRKTLKETCNYAGGSDIDRYQEVVSAALVSAATGDPIASETFTCTPRECLPWEIGFINQLSCKVKVKQVIAWAEEFLANPPPQIQKVTGALQQTATPAIQTPIATATTVRPTSRPTPTAQPEAVVNASSVRVRSSPDTNSSILAGLKRNNRVKIIGVNAGRDWVKVKLADGQQGWVFAELLTLPIPINSLPVVN